MATSLQVNGGGLGLESGCSAPTVKTTSSKSQAFGQFGGNPRQKSRPPDRAELWIGTSTASIHQEEPQMQRTITSAAYDARIVSFACRSKTLLKAMRNAAG